MRYRLRTLLIVLALAGPLIGLGGWAVAVLRHWNLACCQVSGVFSEAPSDDLALEGWLKQQPGVRTSSVFRDGTGAIHVYWDVYYPVLGAQPPALDVAPVLSRFGYAHVGPLELHSWHES